MTHIMQSLYDKCPYGIQNIMLSSYGLYLNYQRYGRRFIQQSEEFGKMQWWDYDRLVGYQNTRLRNMIAHVYDNVPYYRKIMKKEGLKPTDIQSQEDLWKLPLLTREDIKKNFNDLIAESLGAVQKKRLIKGHTSGTTGSPLEFYWDRETCLINNVVHWRQKYWAGLQMHDRCAVLLGRTIVPIKQEKPPFWRMNYTHNTLWLSSFHLTSKNLPLYVQTLRELKPRYIEGYPSTLYILAKYLESKGETLELTAALTSSETLYPYQRTTIENSFACKVYDYYGLAERVVFASECESHVGHHINMDYTITEVVNDNGSHVGTEKMGWIVGTGLYNYAMPLIRYKTNDISAIKAKKCACGRAFPLLEDVTTKAEDIITTGDGRFISSSILTHPFKPLTNIVKSQIIQEDVKNIRIIIVKGPSYNNQDTELLISEMQKRVGADMKIHIEYTDEIPATASGKFRWVISRVPLSIA